MIKAVIFDMDGLLIDSEPLWQKAEIAAFEEVNIHMSIEECIQTTGMRTDEVVDYWYKRRPWKGRSREEMTEDITRRLIDLVNQQGKLMPGAKAAIQFLHDQQIKTALASSSNYRIIDAVLSKFNLSTEFHVVHSAQEEDFGKPHPAVYLSTARKLEEDPTECLALEDSLMGVIAAKAARMSCIAIPLSRDDRFIIADLKLNSLTEFDLKIWNRIQEKAERN